GRDQKEGHRGHGPRLAEDGTARLREGPPAHRVAPPEGFGFVQAVAGGRVARHRFGQEADRGLSPRGAATREVARCQPLSDQVGRRPLTRQFRFKLAIVVAVAVIVRAVYVIAVLRDRGLGLDGDSYRLLAQSLRDGHGYSSVSANGARVATATFPPGYPAYLA